MRLTGTKAGFPSTPTEPSTSSAPVKKSLPTLLLFSLHLLQLGLDALRLEFDPLVVDLLHPYHLELVQLLPALLGPVFMILPSRAQSPLVPALLARITMVQSPLASQVLLLIAPVAVLHMTGVLSLLVLYSAPDMLPVPTKSNSRISMQYRLSPMKLPLLQPPLLLLQLPLPLQVLEVMIQLLQALLMVVVMEEVLVLRPRSQASIRGSGSATMD